MVDRDAIEKRWNKTGAKLLAGRKIVAVRYMTEKEADDHGWMSRPVVIQLDNGVLLYPSRDDEGNDGGALFTTDEEVSILPVI